MNYDSKIIWFYKNTVPTYIFNRIFFHKNTNPNEHFQPFLHAPTIVKNPHDYDLTNLDLIAFRGNIIC